MVIKDNSNNILILLFSFLTVLLKWSVCFYYFDNENLLNKLIFDIEDYYYFPHIINFLEFDFSPDYLKNFPSKNSLPIPIYSIIFHVVFIKLFGFASFIILEFLCLYLFLIILVNFFNKFNLNPNIALLSSILFFILPIIFSYISFPNFKITTLENLYSFRFPRPLVTSLYFFWGLYLSIIFYESNKINISKYAFIGIVLGFTFVSYYYSDGVAAEMLEASIITIFIGVVIMLLTKNKRKELQKRDGYVIVTFGWIFMSLAGTLPYIITGAIPSFTDAFFETMSGYTTTGASILNDIESIPYGVLFWRSITHWIGGMGIIVLAIAILPLLGIGGMELFTAEAPGPSSDKLHPRITDTAKRLWLIYVGYTVAETILLKLAGMSMFDAVNHSLSTLSTGGFSTKNASMAYWNDQPLIQYIVIVFMFLAGTNFVLSYFAFKTKFSKILQNEEFKFYVISIVIFTLMASLIIYFQTDITQSTINHPMVWGRYESSFRHSAFQIIAIITTTGFVSADYTLWTPFLTVFFFGLMFLGGSAGSTAGGIKIVRHIILIKNGLIEFRRSLHPRAVLPVRYNTKAVQQPIVLNILGFFILYFLSFIIGVLVFSLLGLDFQTALGGAASSLGNIGPALGDLGPVNNHASLSNPAKWWSAFLMLIGRLELFTVLILLTPYFWRNR